MTVNQQAEEVVEHEEIEAVIDRRQTSRMMALERV